MVISKCFTSISEFSELDGLILFFISYDVVILFLICYAPILMRHMFLSDKTGIRF